MNLHERQQTRSVMLAVAGVIAALALWLGATAAMLWATLAPDERQQAATLLGPRAALLVFAGVVLLAGLAWAVPRAYRRWVAAPAQLLEQTRVLLASAGQSAFASAFQPALASAGSPALQGLAQAINGLVAQRGQLQADIALQVQAASHSILLERNRLAALMSELTQAVLVCNLDGRILLYNSQARAQFRTLSTAPALADGAELIGLGRSIYAVIDQKLLAHALAKIAGDPGRGSNSPTAQFLTTTASGQWLRVQLAPVRSALPADAGSLNGFVLMLANITREFEQASEQDQWLLGLTEGSRASLGNLRAAFEMLDYPDLSAAQRQRFEAVVNDEIQAMGQRLQSAAAQTTQGLANRWPLEDLLGADLVAAALRQINALPGLRGAAAEVDASLWLKADSFSLLQALVGLAGCLAEEYGIKLVQLRLAPAGGGVFAHLDLVWAGQALSTETVMGWETDALRIGSATSPLTVRDVVQRHGGEFWFERERVRHAAFFRFLLPLADAQPTDAQPTDAHPADAQPADDPAEPPAAARAAHDGRPEYYDFDLFQITEHSRTLDERPLGELTYTVFDTETTGLDPAGGDQILQIGATRLVNGKLRRQECFEQLVDPQRSIPAAGIAIHGIVPAMVRGMPTLGQVLPGFHAFAQDSVLVAHNAAFDMRFLQRQEAATGLRFDQPVLDTLLLSAVLHPNQPSHQLEAIAGRLGVEVAGRHSALGDALITAEVFQKLIPLLAAHGIHTLGQARAASQSSFYARVKY